MTAPSLAALLCVPFLAISICGIGGKKTEKDVCKHMDKVLEDEGKPPLGDDLLAACETSMKKDLATCPQRREAIDCYMKLDSSDDKTCNSICKKPSRSYSKYSSSKSTSGKASSAKIDCINECTRKYGPVLDKNKLASCRQRRPNDLKGCMDEAMNTPAGRCLPKCKNL